MPVYKRATSLPWWSLTARLTQVRARDLRRLLCLLYNGYADVTLEAAAELKEVWKHLDINIVE